ncbi:MULTISPECIES: winged helix-turn-helix transcriptional regulator [unclassified Methylobacterium]|uniref:winged helix-turn-helix transcriptional regulator n=1 Tax=unclassified Methylobacterium TaxID=2615210 RepID=UPI0009E97B90|nr:MULTISPECIES: winged helix-turn-helix transcriptional regulator [unclassified Methylobacterium]
MGAPLTCRNVPLRFSAPERRVEGVDRKMAIRQREELEKDGIVTRTVTRRCPRLEYALSEIGIALGASRAGRR